MKNQSVSVRVVKSMFVAAAVLAALALLAPARADAHSLPTDIPVAGAFDGGTFAGTLDVVRFEEADGAMVAVGALTGTLVDSAGNAIGAVTDQAVTLPVDALAATCDVLHLDLGPLNLDLLGLEVHLQRVVLDIVADAGGGLLGSLLCALAGLLDLGGAIGAIIDLLNRILDILSLFT
jgi:ABC-type amino acid transport substrate-binding protein